MSLTDEWYLHCKLKLRGSSAGKFGIFDGLTDFDQRRERTRSAIRNAGLDAEECWTVKGTSQTFAQAFRSVYAEEL